MEIIEMGTISSRGQVAIPASIREHLGLEEGTRVVFSVQEDALIMKTVKSMSWDEITKPLKEAPKKIKEEEVTDLIHKLRKKWKNEDNMKLSEETKKGIAESEKDIKKGRITSMEKIKKKYLHSK